MDNFFNNIILPIILSVIASCIVMAFNPIADWLNGGNDKWIKWKDETDESICLRKSIMMNLAGFVFVLVEMVIVFLFTTVVVIFTPKTNATGRRIIVGTVIISIVVAIVAGFIFKKKINISCKTTGFSWLGFGYIFLIVFLSSDLIQAQFNINPVIMAIIRHLDVVWVLSIIILIVRWLRIVLWYLRPVVTKRTLNINEAICNANFSGEVNKKIKNNEYKLTDNFIIINELKGSQTMMKDYRIPISQVGYIKYEYHYREKSIEPLPTIFKPIVKKEKEIKTK